MGGDRGRAASLTLSGSPGEEALARLLARAARSLERGPPLLRCRVARLEPCLRSLDALGRVCLLARRSGCPVVLVEPSPELLELIELAGLSAALGAATAPVGGEGRTGGRSSGSRGRR